MLLNRKPDGGIICLLYPDIISRYMLILETGYTGIGKKVMESVEMDRTTSAPNYNVLKKASYL